LNVLILIAFTAGLALLVVGADTMVRGSAAVAARLGTPPLVIGLTVVAFGTSSPEVVVSLHAAYAGDPQIALGNVIGSNIFNVLFILGASAVVAPLVVSEGIVRRDVPVMIAVTAIVVLFALNGRFSRFEGVLLLAGITVYAGALVTRARRLETPDSPLAVRPRLDRHWTIDVVLIVVGLGVQVLGARLLVNAAVTVATQLGVSSLIVGLTIVAVGTSLPEVATSIAASLRGQRDIAVGNVIGSNIFNLLLVLGSAAVVSPVPFLVPPGALTFDLPIMLAVSVACLPIFVSGYTLARWEGAIFVAYYLAYATFLVLDATQHEMASLFGGVMVGFVLPLTILTFVVVTLRRRAARRRND
jgi:cation:H+ antiporter